MKLGLVLAVLFAASAAQTQTIRIVPVLLDPTATTPKTIRFFCTSNYRRQECLGDIFTLRQALEPYPLSRLGAWSFVVVSADDWRSLVLSLGGDPTTPAFTSLEQRTTILEQSLFAANANRKKELLLQFGVSGKDLLYLAVTHELGHGICKDGNEHRADEFSRNLRLKKPALCVGSRKEEMKRASR